MLKPFIRSEIKEAVILLVFAGLMFETLNIATVALVCLGTVMVWFRKRPQTLVRNVLTLALFCIYWMTYGKVIDPEVGLNFLTSIVVFKLLEKNTDRDQYMIFFGLILLISAGSLFQKSLSYVIFFSLSFLILILDFYKNINISNRVKDLLQSLIWVLPFTAFLFFFAPRIMNPFQLGKSAPKEGEVGYTPEVNITQIESLSSNETAVFQATVDREVSSKDLYWRGNTLSFSNGWNWPLMPSDGPSLNFEAGKAVTDSAAIRQKIRVFSQQPFFFGFDHPRFVVTQSGVATLNETASLSQNRWKHSQRYQVISFTGNIQDSRVANLTRSGLNPKEKKWINDTFKARELSALTLEIENYFLQNKFSYSFSPGRIENILEFLRDKKVGFCSHYASSVALILRTKNIPARLVSGFMGGTYNKFGSFYLVSHNDAHVWVEAFSNGQWKRLDPTGWIAPDRVLLGGAGFMEQHLSSRDFSIFRSFRSRLPILNDFKQWFAQWDFRFYQWIEEMDYYWQESFFEKLHIKREWIFSFIPILLALFMGLYTWNLARKRPKNSDIEKLWLKFQTKLKKQGIVLRLHSVSEGAELLKDKQEALTVWNDLVLASFNRNHVIDIEGLKAKINKL